MSDDNPVAELTLTVEEGGPSVDVGDTVTGTITGTEIKEFEYDDEDVRYYQLNIDPDIEGDWEFTPDWPARVTPGTGLGRLCKRFGANLTIGGEVSLHELFEPGQKVEFEIGEREYTDSEGEEQTAMIAEEETVRPEGQDLEDYDATDVPADNGPDEDEDEEDDDVRPEVLEFIDEREGDDRTDIIKALGSEHGGEYVKAFKSLEDDGDVEVEDGMVFLGTA